MASAADWSCQECGFLEFSDEDDGFRYCSGCGAKAEEFVDTGNPDEDFLDTGGRGTAIYSASNVRQRRQEPDQPSLRPSQNSLSQFWSALTPSIAAAAETDDKDRPTGPDLSQFWSDLTPSIVPAAETDDRVGPTGPEDFGWMGKVNPSFQDYHNELRMRYVMGLQLMVQLQCEALCREFKVSPLICGFAGTVWLRYLKATGVFDDGWCDDSINESESQKLEDPPEHFKPRHNHAGEPHNLYGQRALTIWLGWLRKNIPVSHTLSVSFLVCHLAREPILPTDIERWSIEGKLPYFSAFMEVENQIGGPSRACPMKSESMFGADYSVTAQKIESTAAAISESIGLALPPVNFYALASRFLRKMLVPVEEILEDALKIYEWTMPAELWLSRNEARLPTRVGVMSILIFAIRNRYNIHGFGAWEESLSREESDDRVEDQNRKLDTAELLRNLRENYYEFAEKSDHLKDLPTYLRYCSTVVFPRSETSLEDRVERKLADALWKIYQSNKVEGKEENLLVAEDASDEDDDHDDDQNMNDRSYLGDRDLSNIPSLSRIKGQNSRDREVRQLKAEMEEDRFRYIPPRLRVKRRDYLHYSRKKSNGSMTYVAHADYYILLRACAMAAGIEIRLMHIAVLGFERRLEWTERRIQCCLNLKLTPSSCHNCNPESDSLASMGLDDIHF